MKFSNQQKICITQAIKKEINKTLKRPLRDNEKLIMRIVADAIINLPAED